MLSGLALIYNYDHRYYYLCLAGQLPQVTGWLSEAGSSGNRAAQNRASASKCQMSGRAKQSLPLQTQNLVLLQGPWCL